ncbi:MAG: hypothetical protein PVF49_13430, partial [Anaerolineales bacterium]
IHATSPIAEPRNGLSNGDIIRRLGETIGSPVGVNSDLEAADELSHLVRMHEQNRRGSFNTPDGKAHFVLYSDRVGQTSASVPDVLEIEARMARRMKEIKA